MARFLHILLLVPLLFLVSFTNEVIAEDKGDGKLVYVIPIEDNVERGLEAFIRRSTNEAIQANADHVIFEINTPGGRVDAALEIGAILQNLEMETTSFVTVKALSAGSYIALNTDNIYFTPQASMGASQVIVGDGNAADDKAQSAWIAAMRGAASSKGRDPIYAEAMADPDVDLPDYGAGKGKLLTLDANSAVEVDYASGLVPHRTELLHELGLSNAEIIEMDTTAAEGIARFLTDPIVVPILLSLASIGLVVELYSPGFGIPGSIGLLSLVLYFYGHFVAGLAGYESLILLVVGIILLIIEVFAPGGILGFIGIGAIVGSLFMSTDDPGHMSMSIAIALVLTIIVSVILFKTIGLEKGILRHVILKDATTTESGYVSNVNRLDLIGMEGVTVTPLRPSGTAVFNDDRLDVVSEGAFVSQGAQVKIIKTEGSRVVVREVTK